MSANKLMEKTWSLAALELKSTLHSDIIDRGNSLRETMMKAIKMIDENPEGVVAGSILVGFTDGQGISIDGGTCGTATGIKALHLSNNHKNGEALAAAEIQAIDAQVIVTRANSKADGVISALADIFGEQGDDCDCDNCVKRREQKEPTIDDLIDEAADAQTKQ